MPVQITDRNIAAMKTDAIINPTDATLSLGKIKTNASPKLRNMCSLLGSSPYCPGDVVVTLSYGLPAENIVHVVTEGMEDSPEAWLDCYKSILECAQQNGWTSIAIPVFPEEGSTRYTREKIYSIAKQAVRDLTAEKDLLVYFVTANRNEIPININLLHPLTDYIRLWEAEYSELFEQTESDMPKGSRRYSLLYDLPDLADLTTPFVDSEEEEDLEEYLDSHDKTSSYGFSSGYGGNYSDSYFSYFSTGSDHEGQERPEAQPDEDHAPCPEEADDTDELGFEGIKARSFSAPSQRPFAVPVPGENSKLFSAYSDPRSDADMDAIYYDREGPVYKYRGKKAPAEPLNELHKTDGPADLRSMKIEMGESFATAVLRLIKEKGLTDPQCYTKANLSRAVFNKLKQSGLNSTAHYQPSKATALALIIALELSLDEAKELLEKAGYALSHSDRRDIIVEFFIVSGTYDIFELNEVLFRFDQSPLGSF